MWMAWFVLGKQANWPILLHGNVCANLDSEVIFSRTGFVHKWGSSMVYNLLVNHHIAPPTWLWGISPLSTHAQVLQ
jgi:hypothetical protein